MKPWSSSFSRQRELWRQANFARVWRWLSALGIPWASLYLLSGHPRLVGVDFFGLGTRELFALHGVVCLAVVALSVLFSRSRAALLSTLLLALTWLASTGWIEPAVAGLSLGVGGVMIIAAPDRRLFRPNSAIWTGAALVGVVGTATVLELYRSPMRAAAALAVWGSLLLYARVRQERSAPITEPLLLASLAWSVALLLAWGNVPEAWSSSGYAFMALLAGIPSLVSLISHSFRLAYIDELTEIPGRRALVEALDEPGSVFTLAMLDVDHFKKFNDTHGHEVGDQVLRMVAARIATVGKGGAAYRYGGEEFTLLFPGKSVDDVGDELERLRQLVESSPLYLRGEDRPKEKPKASKAKGGKSSKGAPKKKAPSVGVTVSIGVATRRPSETWDKVMKRADQALYKAKQAGRNQVAEAS